MWFHGIGGVVMSCWHFTFGYRDTFFFGRYIGNGGVKTFWGGGGGFIEILVSFEAVH